MKIYGRTLLFFLGAISFQALLTAGPIIGLVSRNNRTVTRAELHEESAVVYDRYNEWVRTMWRSVIRIRDDEDLAVLAEGPGSPALNLRLVKRMESSLRGTGVDSFVVRRGGWNHFEILADAYPFVGDFTPFAMDRDHPYISLRTIEESAFLVAAAALGPEAEIYLLKEIDEDFYNQLKTRDHTRVFVSSDTEAIWNTVGKGEDRSDLLALEETYPPYREAYDLNFGRGHYHASIRNLGHLEGYGELRLLVFMSVEPYFSLLVRIGRIVLLVSLVTAVLTAVVAVFFSGRLTRPVQELARAARDVWGGNLDIVVPADASGEIRELVEEFNAMVHRLRENRVLLDENLREITFLNDYNETIIHSLRAGILVVDGNMEVEKTNSFYRECFLSGEDAPEGRPLAEAGPAILDDEILGNVRAVAEGLNAGWSGVRRDGETVWEVKVYPLGGSGIRSRGQCVVEFDDISAKTDLEQKIMQAEKLSSLSLLSAGIAHEINNPLSTILSNAQMLLSRNPDGPMRDSLEWIERETKRIAGIVRDLREFSHADENTGIGTDMNACVEEAVRLVGYGVPGDSGTEITFTPGPGPLLVRIPGEELRQAVLNLLQNAVQALDGDGRIDIETTELGGGRRGVVISDSGPGIPEDIISRIFDPFFTTKPDGVGTGLGLSLVYGIVRKFGGDIDVRSREGEGSVFTLSLPAERSKP